MYFVENEIRNIACYIAVTLELHQDSPEGL